MPRASLLLISQVYVPDPASVGQHLHDVGAEIVRRGYRVRVFASSRGYDAPEVRFAAREAIQGVDVRRLPLSSFGKRSILIRLAAQISFLAQAILRGLLTPGLRAILVSTSPPMCAAAALLIAAVRRLPIVYWVMDINPDQAVALGTFNESSLPVRLFDVLNRTVLRRAHAVVTLDRFMAARLRRKAEVGRKLSVFPPWPHEDHLEDIPHERNPFRKAHRLDGKFVVMYSGNHSPANPIITLLRAAERLRHRRDIVFLFVGGGACKREVAEAVARGAKNVLDLPYQPLCELKYSLSAADLHVVSVGPSSVGIVHPCKVYGAMAVARPILGLGPRPSHVSDILEGCDVGRQVGHGQVGEAARAIVELADMPAARRAEMGRRARRFVRSRLAKNVLCAQLGEIVEAALRGRPSPQFGSAGPERGEMYRRPASETRGRKAA